MRNDCCVFEYCNFGKSSLKIFLMSRSGEVEKEITLEEFDRLIDIVKT